MPYDEYNVPQEKNNGNHLCGAVRVGRDSLTSNSLFIFASGRKNKQKSHFITHDTDRCVTVVCCAR